MVTELSELVGQRSAMATRCQTKNISAHPSISISDVKWGYSLRLKWQEVPNLAPLRPVGA